MSDNRTDELRRLLDERGEEHYDGTESTLWLKDEHGYRASADELSSGRLSVHIWCDTPEQVIAATLGSESVDYMLNTIGKLEEENERLRSSCGTLTAEQVRKCVRVGACDHGLWGALDEDTDWQAIADELNAELGSERIAELEAENERLRKAGYEIGYHDAMAAAGSGTCELVETDSYSNANEVVHVLECSACGETCEHVNGSYPRCPYCGRKVVSA